MFLICTAESSKVWEALCESVSLNLIESIEYMDVEKTFNFVVNPIEKSDIQELEQHSNVNVMLVASPCLIQFAQQIKQLTQFDLSTIQTNLERTLSLASSFPNISIWPISVFFKNNYQSFLPKEITRVLPVFDYPLGTAQEIALANSAVQTSPSIKQLDAAVLSCIKEELKGYYFQADMGYSHTEELLNVFRQLQDKKQENQVLFNQLSVSNREVATSKLHSEYAIKSLEQDVSVLTSQLFVLQHYVEQEGEILTQGNAKNIKSLALQKKQLELENKILKERIENKIKTEHGLRSKLAELKTIKQSWSWKIISKLDNLSATINSNVKQRRRLLEDVSLVYSSELFDADWYLSNYDDVKQSGIDPAEHYLLFGAKEGRRPSMEFNGDWYLKRYPDVAESGLNPLLHYVKYGKEENRAISRLY